MISNAQNFFLLQLSCYAQLQKNETHRHNQALPAWDRERLLG